MEKCGVQMKKTLLNDRVRQVMVDHYNLEPFCVLRGFLWVEEREALKLSGSSRVRPTLIWISIHHTDLGANSF